MHSVLCELESLGKLKSYLFHYSGNEMVSQAIINLINRSLIYLKVDKTVIENMSVTEVVSSLFN